MMIKPLQILKELTEFVSLDDGDIVMTGTPKGVGLVKLNDHFIGTVHLSKSDNNLSSKEVLVSQQWFAQ